MHVFSIVKKLFRSEEEICEVARLAHFNVNVILHYGLGENLLKAFVQILSRYRAQCGALYDKQALLTFVEYIPANILPYYYETFQLPAPKKYSPNNTVPSSWAST